MTSPHAALRWLPPALVAIGCGLALLRAWRDVPAIRSFEFRDGRTVHVVDVHRDGTIDVGQGLRLRLLGVEKPLEPAAVEWLDEQVTGRNVELHFDRERLDDEGHVLAFVDADGTDVNLEIVRLGLGTVDRRFPFASTRKRALLKAEAAATDAAAGRGTNP